MVSKCRFSCCFLKTSAVSSSFTYSRFHLIIFQTWWSNYLGVWGGNNITFHLLYENGHICTPMIVFYRQVFYSDYSVLQIFCGLFSSEVEHLLFEMLVWCLELYFLWKFDFWNCVALVLAPSSTFGLTSFILVFPHQNFT